MYKTLVLPLIATLLLHASIILMFLVDWDDSEARVVKVQPSYVKAKLVTLDKPKARPAEKKPVPQKPQDDKAARQREQAKQLEAAKQKEASKQKELARQKEVAKQKAVADLAEKQRQQEQQRRREEQLERELAQAIADESVQQQAATDAELAGSYIGMMTNIIQRNWSRPPSARNNMEVELEIRLVPTGDVVNVNIIKSSGNDAFDRSAVKAVEKAGRFPELQQLPGRVFEQNFRRLIIIFRPEDLRL